MRFLVAIFLFLHVGVATHTARAEAVEGFAALAASHELFYPENCNQILRFYRALPAVFHAELWKSFGTNRRCAKRVFKLDQQVTFLWYMSNEVCRRKGNCFDHELASDLSVSEFNQQIIQKKKAYKQAKKIARKSLKFCERYKKAGDKCLFAIGLESQYNEKAAKALVEMARSVGWPEASIVHNPVNISAFQGFAGAHYLEHHGLKRVQFAPASRSIVTLDGVDPSFCNRGRPGIPNTVSKAELREWRNYYRNNASFIGYWCSVHQGIRGDSAVSPNPRARSPHVDPGDIDQLLGIVGPLPVKPPKKKDCDKAHKLDGPGGFLWKESDHGGLVVLFPKKFKRAFKRVRVGKDSLRYSGFANGDRQHWRHSKSSREFADGSLVKAIANKKHGKKHCWNIGKAGERND